MDTNRIASKNSADDRKLPSARMPWKKVEFKSGSGREQTRENVQCIIRIFQQV